MKNRLSNVTSIALALVMLLTLALAAGYPPVIEEAPTRYPLTITDSVGETIVIEEPVERVIVIFEGVLEAIRALGAAEKVVGVPDWIRGKTGWFPELSQKPCIGAWRAFDTETILMLDPCIVFRWAPYITPEQLREAELEAAGIKVVALKFDRPEILTEEMLLLGKILDRETEAAAYVEWRNKWIDLVVERVAGIPAEDRPRVFGEWVSGGVFGRWAMAGGEMHDLITMAGGINIAYGLGGDRATAAVETEWILTQNPDVYLIRHYFEVGGYTTADPAGMRAIYEKARALPGFAEHVAAIRNNRLHIIDDDAIHGLAFPVALIYIAKWLHPELFADLDPVAVHQELIDTFWPGIEFDIAIEGAFTYPPVE